MAISKVVPRPRQQRSQANPSESTHFVRFSRGRNSVLQGIIETAATVEPNNPTAPSIMTETREEEVTSFVPTQWTLFRQGARVMLVKNFKNTLVTYDQYYDTIRDRDDVLVTDCHPPPPNMIQKLERTISESEPPQMSIHKGKLIITDNPTTYYDKDSNLLRNVFDNRVVSGYNIRKLQEPGTSKPPRYGELFQKAGIVPPS
jgi:hypothetical protein